MTSLIAKSNKITYTSYTYSDKIRNNREQYTLINHSRSGFPGRIQIVTNFPCCRNNKASFCV